MNNNLFLFFKFVLSLGIILNSKYMLVLSKKSQLKVKLPMNFCCPTKISFILDLPTYIHYYKPSISLLILLNSHLYTDYVHFFLNKLTFDINFVSNLNNDLYFIFKLFTFSSKL